MEESASIRFDSIALGVRKKRTRASRRPRPDSQPTNHGPSPSDDFSKVSSDENTGHVTGFKRKEINVNEQGQNGYNNNNKRYSEGVLAPAKWRGITTNGHSGRNGEPQSSGHENKVKKVRLKVGGVTRMIHGNSSSNHGLEDGSSTKSTRSSDDIRQRSKVNIRGNSDDIESSPSDLRKALQGIPWKDFSGSGFNPSNEDSSMRKISIKSSVKKQEDESEPSRKSRRVSKKRQFDDEDDDNEIRYLEKLKNIKANNVVLKDTYEEQEPNKKLRKISVVAKKSVAEKKLFDDTDFDEENELGSDCDLQSRKKPRKESIEVLMDSSRSEIALTTRQRAIHLGKDSSSTPGASLEFPNGLPPAPSRKQKEKLTELEQQLKKAEAAKKRKAQNEKAARESEAEAIRKILGQDSNRKKKEDKIKKRQEELAQERAANALVVGPNTIRWVMGPTGTTVTFSADIGLPSIFNSKTCSYPPPREKCAGPSCTNPYKYRDSKSKLPLCSLHCYKAVQENNTQTEITC